MANTPSLSLFISSMLFLMLGSTITADPVAYSCTYLSYANHTSNSSKYLANLDLLLQSLSYNANATSGTGFYNTTIGDGSDKVYGLFLCRGDFTSNDCQTCIETASAEIKPICPNNTAAVAYYDKCMLRYANQSIFSVLQQEPFLQALAPNNFTKLDKYNQTVADLLHRLVNQAVNGSFAVTPKHYAAGEEIYYTGFDTIYGLVQCTPDITSNECNNCLTGSVNLDVPKLIYPRQGGRILKPSCNIRFEFNSPFYEIVASPPATPPSTNSSITPGKGRNSAKVITILAVANGVTFIMVVIIFILYRRVQRRKLKAEDGDDVIDITSVDFIQFNFDTIKAATDNFSDENKLGEGGFGAVYKGNLSNGQTVAVKRLSRNSVQGEIEFKNEVKLAAKLQHRNLVRILGFCFKGLEKLIVYEFVPNKSLDRYIFDPSKSSQLNWENRYNIIEGIARGILYLHEDSRLKIIHRDLKASNILLDEEMNPKIADFGMARLFIADQSQSHTNRVVGTYGYMAPEYVMHGQVSVKTDVYSFGVLLLEIVSGQRNNSLNQLSGSSEENLLNHAWRKWREGEALSLVDPNLGEHYNRSEVIRCIHIGLLCIQEDVSNRPTMATVVLMLNSYSVSLPQPASSASQMGSNLNLYEFSADSSRLTESSQSTEPSEGKSINKMSITDLSPR